MTRTSRQSSLRAAIPSARTTRSVATPLRRRSNRQRRAQADSCLKRRCVMRAEHRRSRDAREIGGAASRSRRDLSLVQPHRLIAVERQRLLRIGSSSSQRWWSGWQRGRSGTSMANTLRISAAHEQQRSPVPAAATLLVRGDDSALDFEAFDEVCRATPHELDAVPRQTPTPAPS